MAPIAKRPRFGVGAAVAAALLFSAQLSYAAAQADTLTVGLLGYGVSPALFVLALRTLGFASSTAPPPTE